MRKRPIPPVATPETRSPRAPVPVRGVRVTLTLASGHKTVRGWARTLAVGGMYVETPVPMPAEAEVEISWLARLGDTPYHLKMLGWVVYFDGEGLGIQFDPASVAANPVIDKLVAAYLEAGGGHSARPNP